MTPFEKKLKLARMNMASFMPFFAYLAFHTEVYASEAGETAWTDGRHVWFNPKFAEGLSYGEFTFVYAHELLHKALLHVPRVGSRHPTLWNIATDYYINLELNDVAKNIGGNRQLPVMEMPQQVLCDEKYRGYTADQIYEMLRQEFDKDGDIGVCIHMDDLKPGGTPMTSGEQAEVARQLAGAAQAAKMAGKMPGGLQRAIDALLRPTRNWRNELESLVSSFPTDYGYSPPDRRFLDEDFYLPAMQGEKVTLWVAVDTSGSIGQAELTRFMSETMGIVQGFEHVELKIVVCDADIQEVHDFQTGDDVNAFVNSVKFKGGGGTDFIPVFNLALQEDTKPNALVFFTDGFGSFPETEPEFPTLWCIINGMGSLEPEKFPFGRVVEVDYN
ncbi:MAG: VWA-like domain-containing protein [Meiothermus sp.]|nr:VWA-like domain-containing protein [Meiothermus sp.]